MKQAWSRICNQVKRVYKASPWVRWAAIPALLLGCAVLVELFFFQGKLLRLPQEEKGIHSLQVQEIELKNLSEEERQKMMLQSTEAEKLEQALEDIETDRQTKAEKDKAGAGDGTVTIESNEQEKTYNLFWIPVEKGYTNKLVIYMQSNNTYFDYTVRVVRRGNGGEQTALDYQKRGVVALGKDHLKLGENASGYVVFTEAEDKVIGAEIDNTLRLNSRRIFFMFSLGLAVYLLAALRRQIGQKLEIGFLIVVLCAGLSWVYALPTNVNLSWDDQIHFDIASQLTYGSGVMERSEAEVKLRDLDLTGQARAPMKTMEDELAFNQYLDELSRQKAENTEYRSWNLSDIGFITQTLGMKLGQCLGLPFHVQFMLGRLGNLLMYAAVCYFAIKVAVRYKVILATIALMPTVMNMVCTYSYDPMVISFALLGTSLFITEMMIPERRLDWKRAALLLVSFCLASFPKAVYIPMILLLLALPKRKFANAKAHWVYKIGVVIIFLMMMSTFVLPTLISPGTGDIRGGQSVNTGKQLMFILHNPVAFIKVLVKSIASFSMTHLTEARLSLVYIGNGLESTMQAMAPLLDTVSLGLMFYVLFTDKYKKPEAKEMSRGSRWWMAACLAAVVVLIWTAMYLSFTGVGFGMINGVQGRYFVPMFLLMAALINPRKIVNTAEPVRYNLMILGLNAFVVFGIVWVYFVGSVWL